jgi:hypothetical protein
LRPALSSEASSRARTRPAGSRQEHWPSSGTATAGLLSGATEGLQVHHIVRLEDGGAEFDQANCKPSASVVIVSIAGGIGGRPPARRSHQRPAIRETNRSRGALFAQRSQECPARQ